MAYIKNLLIGIDQVFNVILLGAPDETLSSRTFRLRRTGFGRIAYKVINGIFFWQQDHCREAFESEVKRKESGSAFVKDAAKYLEASTID